MVLDSKKFSEYVSISENLVRNPIFPKVLLIGLNMPLCPSRSFFCVNLDPRWTPELVTCKGRKNAWSSIGFQYFFGLSSVGVLCRFGPPICGKGGVK